MPKSISVNPSRCWEENREKEEEKWGNLGMVQEAVVEGGNLWIKHKMKDKLEKEMFSMPWKP